MVPLDVTGKVITVGDLVLGRKGGEGIGSLFLVRGVEHVQVWGEDAVFLVLGNPYFVPDDMLNKPWSAVPTPGSSQFPGLLRVGQFRDLRGVSGAGSASVARQTRATDVALGVRTGDVVVHKGRTASVLQMVGVVTGTAEAGKLFVRPFLGCSSHGGSHWTVHFPGAGELRKTLPGDCIVLSG